MPNALTQLERQAIFYLYFDLGKEGVTEEPQKPGSVPGFSGTRGAWLVLEGPAGERQLGHQDRLKQSGDWIVRRPDGPLCLAAVGPKKLAGS